MTAHGRPSPGAGPRGPRPVPRVRVAVLSAGWTADDGGELAAAVRSVAGSLSRAACVDVLVPGRPGSCVPDGAFDPGGIGLPGEGRRWPSVADAGRGLDALDAARAGEGGPQRPAYRAVVVEAGDAEALEVAAALFPGLPVGAVGPAPASGTGPAGAVPAGRAAEPRALAVDLRDPGPGGARVGLYARVHPGAASSPHQALGPLAPYLLVLGDRPGAPPAGPVPSDRVRWLLARFPRHHVVLLEQATAVVWRSRSALRSFRVHTRMDLWRLLAHARATVDLLPGAVYARECVESLRYGVPVVALGSSPVDALAAEGGALSFSGTVELLERVEALCDPGWHGRVAAAGRDTARRWYGDPAAFLRRLCAALTLEVAPVA